MIIDVAIDSSTAVNEDYEQVSFKTNEVNNLLFQCSC